jgi:hypothetical protein
MKSRWAALAATVAVAFAAASPALAAPDNKNVEFLDVTCPDPIGTVQVATIGSGSPGWTPDGTLAVAKTFSVSAPSLVVSDEDGELESFPLPPFEENQGKKTGQQDRLVQCTFDISEPIFEGELTQGIADQLIADFGLDDDQAAELNALVGTDVTVAIEGIATVVVLFPGKK